MLCLLSLFSPWVSLSGTGMSLFFSMTSHSLCYRIKANLPHLRLKPFPIRHHHILQQEYNDRYLWYLKSTPQSTSDFSLCCGGQFLRTKTNLMMTVSCLNTSHPIFLSLSLSFFFFALRASTFCRDLFIVQRNQCLQGKPQSVGMEASRPGLPSITCTFLYVS